VIPTTAQLLDLIARLSTIIGISEGLADGAFDSETAESTYVEALSTLTMAGHPIPQVTVMAPWVCTADKERDGTCIAPNVDPAHQACPGRKTETVTQ